MNSDVKNEEIRNAWANLQVIVNDVQWSDARQRGNKSLATLLEAAERSVKAEKLLREVVERKPSFFQLHTWERIKLFLGITKPPTREQINADIQSRDTSGQ